MKEVQRLPNSKLPSKRGGQGATRVLNLPFFAEMIMETERLKPNEFVQIAPSDETLKNLKLKDPFSAILIAIRRYVKGQKLPLKVERRTLIDDSSVVPTRRSAIILRRTTR